MLGVLEGEQAGGFNAGAGRQAQQVVIVIVAQQQRVHAQHGVDALDGARCERHRHVLDPVDDAGLLGLRCRGVLLARPLRVSLPASQDEQTVVVVGKAGEHLRVVAQIRFDRCILSLGVDVRGDVWRCRPMLLPGWNGCGGV